ncbi:MAG: PAS domain-containing sensor histidine kinase, partial [Bdellovibrionia bacterium]
MQSVGNTIAHRSADALQARNNVCTIVCSNMFLSRWIRWILSASSRLPSKHTEVDRRQLEATQRLVDSIVENLPDQIFVKDATSLRFVLFNRASEKMTGWSREEMIGKTDYDFFPKSQADFFQKMDREVIASGKVLDIPEEELHTRFKGTIIIHTKKVPIFDRKGNPQFLLGISEDITEKKQREQERIRLLTELEQAVKGREHVLAVVSHDLKNPLTAIKIIAFTLAQRVKNDSQSLKLTGFISNTINSTERLVRDLVDLASFEAGSLRLEKRSLDIKSMLEAVSDLIRPMAEQKSIHLKFNNEEGQGLRVVGDFDRILQIFLNLLGNAIHFTPKQGSVTISVKPNGDAVRFLITDTGPGISPEYLPNIFNRFSNTSRKGVGSAG